VLLDDVGNYLQAQGVGTLQVDLFKGGLPMDSANAPVHDAILALIETAGLPPFHVHTQQAASFEQPVVQVLIRGEPYGYAQARLRAQAAFEALDGLANVTLGTTQYLWIQALQSPFFLRVDEAGRPVIVFNVRVAKALM
jgi:hypothetical protein